MFKFSSIIIVIITLIINKGCSEIVLDDYSHCYENENGVRRCQKRDSPNPETIEIACVGDSITAGSHSSGGNHPYPQQLQILLDQVYGNESYSVTNLGSSGSTMLKRSDKSYWNQTVFQTLTENSWDIVIVMLGTNDAKDMSSGGPDNWQHDCGSVESPSLSECSFANDYADMISVIRTLGKKNTTTPKIYITVPISLLRQGVYGMNQTVINSLFPKLIPMIARENNVQVITQVYMGFGGEDDWNTDPNFPIDGCTLNNSYSNWDLKFCKYWCDKQSCDQCHPNDVGYTHMASDFREGLDF